MKRFLINIFLFTIFSFLFYLCLLFLWGNYIPSIFKPNLNYRLISSGHTFTRLNEIKNVNNIDILFLGSSRAYRSFDTRIYEENNFITFNLGTSAQTPIQTLLLLKRYLDNVQPKSIVYEVFPSTFTMDGIESSLDIIANDKNDLYSYYMAFNLNDIKIYNTLLYGTTRDLFDLNKSVKEPIKIDDDTYITGGFVEKEIKYFNPEVFPKKEMIIIESNLKFFGEVIKEIRRRKIDLILVYVPIAPSLYSSFTNNNTFDSLMSSYSKYYNFNQILKLNDSLHFYDCYHLNQNGVDLFTESLIKIIKEE